MPCFLEKGAMCRAALASDSLTAVTIYMEGCFEKTVLVVTNRTHFIVFIRLFYDQKRGLSTY